MAWHSYNTFLTIELTYSKILIPNPISESFLVYIDRDFTKLLHSSKQSGKLIKNIIIELLTNFFKDALTLSDL